jgi:hypothetical protein
MATVNLYRFFRGAQFRAGLLVEEPGRDQRKDFPLARSRLAVTVTYNIPSAGLTGPPPTIETHGEYDPAQPRLDFAVNLVRCNSNKCGRQFTGKALEKHGVGNAGHPIC